MTLPLALHRFLLVFGWALHFVFVAYVVTGTGVVLVSALRRGNAPPGPLERVFADWLPVSLSGAITAAVVPLLFVQTLHPVAFYSASIILFWRAVPLLPALVAGFYLLYVVKAREAGRLRAAAAAGSLCCWLFAAFTWTSIHLLSRGGWTEAYAAGGLTWWQEGLAVRVVAWLALMVPVGLATVAWQVRDAKGAPWRSMALAAWAGITVAFVAGLGYELIAGRAHGPWAWTVVSGLAAAGSGWAAALPDRRRPGFVAAATSAGAAVALAGAAILREATRAQPWAHREPAESVVRGQGLTTFLVFAVLVTVAVVFVFRGVARDLRAAAAPNE